MLSIRKLTGGYAASDEIVKSVDLDVAPGEILTVIGPNGAGKSTALKLIAGLLNAKSGDILYFGENLVGQSPQARARRGLVFVPQERNVFGALSVAENLEMGAFLEPGAARTRASSLYNRFPILAERRRMPASSLSGGQRQTLAMAIGMMASPRVMLLGARQSTREDTQITAQFANLFITRRSAMKGLAATAGFALAAPAVAQDGPIRIGTLTPLTGAGGRYRAVDGEGGAGSSRRGQCRRRCSRPQSRRHLGGRPDQPGSGRARRAS